VIAATIIDMAQGAAELTVESPAYVVIRFARYAGMVALIGAVTFVLGVVSRARSRGADERFLRAVRWRALWLADAGVAVLISSSMLRIVAQLITIGGPEALLSAPTYRYVLMRTAWGHGWMLEMVAGVFAVWALSRVRRGRSWWLVAASAPLVGVAAALSGHAVALETRAQLAILLDTIHVLAAAGWAGGLATIVFGAVPPAVRAGASAAESLATVVRAFSPIALTCAAALVLSGGPAAWFQMGSIEALWSSQYGQRLLTKLAVLAVMAALGAYNWRRVAPALGGTDGAKRLQRSASAELVFAVLVLVVTAVLVATPTPSSG
jgi:putative copper export protein